MTDSTLVCEGHVGSAHASASCMPVLQQCCRPRGAVFSTLRFQTTADRCLLDAGVDRLGVYLYVQRLGQAGEVVRVAFLRPVIDERHARSSLTLMAQLAWERERSYVPVRCLTRPLGPTCSRCTLQSFLRTSLHTLCPCARHSR